MLELKSPMGRSLKDASTRLVVPKEHFPFHHKIASQDGQDAWRNFTYMLKILIPLFRRKVLRDSVCIV